MYYYLFAFAFLFSICQATAPLKPINAVAQQDPFSIDETYTQLMYSYSAYCPESKIVNWSCFFCVYNLSDTKGFKVASVVQYAPTNTFGYIGNNGKTVEVVFRGTQPASLENWITDLSAFHTKPYPNVPNAFVHSGFMDAYDAVKPAVRSAVASLIASTNATRVVITGHSLGAAIATLCAADLAASLKIPFALYNFGSPRVGNRAFADYIAKIVPTAYRITNKADTVPHLPDTLMGFHHIAQEVWWHTTKEYKICDMSGEDPSCENSRLIWSIPDHLDYLGINLVQVGCTI
jgi:hypothetical protein